MFAFFKKLFGLPTEAEKAAAKTNPIIARAEAGKVGVKTNKPKEAKKTTAKKTTKKPSTKK